MNGTNGTIYSNMSNAYAAFINATKAYDSAYYGGKTDINIAKYTAALIGATASMEPYSFSNVATPDFQYKKPFNYNGVSESDLVYNHYSSLLYATQSYYEPAGSTNNSLTVRLLYPKTVVAFWDGTSNIYFPAMPGYKGAGGWSSKPRALSCFYVGDANADNNNGEIRLDADWGYRNTTGSPDFGWAINGPTGTIPHTRSTANNTTIKTSTGDCINYMDTFKLCLLLVQLRVIKTMVMLHLPAETITVMYMHL